MAQRFVSADRRCIRQIERTQALFHRDAHALRSITLQDLWIDAAAFAPEHQEDPSCIVYFSVAAFSLPCEKVQIIRAMFIEKSFCARVMDDLHVVPVIESGALEVALGRTEPQWLH